MNNKTKKRLPKYAGGKLGGIMNGIGKGANSAGDAAGLLGILMQDDNLKIDPVTRTQRGPISWQKTDQIDMEQVKSDNKKTGVKTTLGAAASGAKIGAVAGPIGSVIGGAIGAIGGGLKSIFGAKKRRRQAREANERIQKENTFNFADAQSDVLSNDYYDDNEDTQGLATFADGKTPVRINSKHTFTPNALLAKGELVRRQNGDVEEVTGGTDAHTDNVPATINPEDAVLSDKNVNPATGNTFADDGRKLSRMEKRFNRNVNRNKSIIADNTAKLNAKYMDRSWNDLIAMQGAPTQNTTYKEGKSWATTPITTNAMPRVKVDTVAPIDPTSFKISPLTSANKNVNVTGQSSILDNFTPETMEGIQNFTSGLSTLAPTIYNAINSSKKEKQVTIDDLYQGNPYESQILSKLAKLRYNPNPELRAVRDAEAKARYNARLTNSYGGVGRAIDTASAIASRRASADVLAKSQLTNNQYAQQLASMMAQLGAQKSAGVSSAKSQAFDINMRNKAASKNSIATALSQLSQYSQTKQQEKNMKKRDDKLSNALQLFARLGMSKEDVNSLIK